MRLLYIAAVAAAAVALAACEKAEDRAALAVKPKFDLRYCFRGEQTTFRLPPAGCVISQNGAYILDLTPFGVLEVRTLRNGQPAEPVWTSRVRAKRPDDSEGAFQSDGNLVVYEAGAPVWSSGPLAGADFRLSMTDDGNLVIRTVDGRTLWTARFDERYCTSYLETPSQLEGGCLISPSGNYVLVLDAAGLEVIPAQGGKALGKPVWSSHSANSGPPGAFMAVQPDGNLVIYDAGKVAWNSMSAGRPGVFRLELTDQGKLLLHGADGEPRWSSDPARAAGS